MVKIYNRQLGSERPGTLANYEERLQGRDNASWAEGSPWMQNFLKTQQSEPFGGGNVAQPQTPETTPKSETTPEYVKTNDPDNGVMDYLTKLLGDPEEEERREKRNRVKMGIAALGDAVRHIGNIYHTTNYAPSQTLGSATEKYKEEIDKEDALSFARKQKVLENLQKFQKQKADEAYRNQLLDIKKQEAATKQANAEKQAAYMDARTKDLTTVTELRGREQERKEADSKHKRAMDERRVRAQERAVAEQARRNRANEAIGWARVKAQKERAANKGSSSVTKGNVTYMWDPDGNEYAVPKGKLTKEQIGQLWGKLRKEGKTRGWGESDEEKLGDILRNREDKTVKRILDEAGVVMTQEAERQVGIFEGLGDITDSVYDTISGMADGLDDIGLDDLDIEEQDIDDLEDILDDIKI